MSDRPVVNPPERENDRSAARNQSIRVKICGVCTEGDAQQVAASGADEIGANFHPGSKRFVSMERAAGWLDELSGRVKRVGVTVNLDVEQLMALWAARVLDALQLHGSEPPELCATLLDKGIPIIKAFALKNRQSLEEIARYPTETSILLDAFAPGQHGGTGRLTDWQLARECVVSFPGRDLYLSGGLNPSNVAEAVRQVSPTAVDVASGVESAPGQKNAALVAAFVEQAHTAANSPIQ